MNLTKIIALIGLVSMALVATGCGKSKTTKTSSTSGSSNVTIADAEAAVAKAKKTKWLWRDTEKTLAEAKKAEQAGDSDKANKLAQEAKEHAELALQQMEEEKNVDRTKFMK